MAERRKIALIFGVQKDWMGGTYYILNLIKTLDFLPKLEKPEIVLICKSINDYDYARNFTEYPFLSPYIIKRPFVKEAINKLFRKIIGHNIVKIITFNEKVDMVYPIMGMHDIKTKNQCIAWIPDFQEKHLPDLFSQKEIKLRDRRNREITASGIPIIFSSNDAKKDYLRFYKNKDSKKFIYHFVTSEPKLCNNSYSILNKYDVSHGEYFFCSNQFWKHKNHRLLFEAIKILNDKGVDVKLLCTGNDCDYRNPYYYSELKQFILKHKLEERIILLGLIDRDEQLTLMAESKAVIQPSLFEGWNTSVEEAKALGKFLILSDLDVHKEQVKENCLFFDKNSSFSLAERMEQLISTKPVPIHSEYNKKILQAANKFMSIIEDINL